MKTTARCPLAGLLLVVLALTSPPSVQADDTRAYSRSDTAETWHPDWMKWVSDSRPLNLMAIPGTHDTMSRYGTVWAETQDLSLIGQLYSGIRALDIRCKLDDDTFKIYHGVMYQHASFDDVLNLCNFFLQQYPSEVIIMRVADEGSDDNDAWKSKLLEYRNGSLGTRIWTGHPSGTEKPTLGDVRGKIVIRDDLDWPEQSATLYDVQKLNWISYRWTDTQFFFQYVDGDISSYEAKETPKDTDYRTYTNPADDDYLYINSASGTDDSLGFFGTGGNVLPHQVASYVNPRALNYLFKGEQNRFTGILQADFPGGALVSAIIAHNLKYATNDTDRAKFRASFQTIFNDSCYALNDEDYDGYSLTSRAAELQLWLGHILPWRGPQGSVRDHWSVIAKEGDRGYDNWAVVTGESSGQSLVKQSDWIDDRSYVALNAVSRADSVTTNELISYLAIGSTLKPEFTGAMDAAGDCRDRAVALKSLVRARFPGVRWNVAVSRTVPLGLALDTRASLSAFAVSSSASMYFYYVWAGSSDESAPVPRAGGPYVSAEGENVLLDASATTDRDNGVLTYRWDFDNNGTWDVETSVADVGRVFSNQGNYTVRLQVSDGENTVETTTTVTVTNVAPVLNLGTATADVLAGNSFSRSCFFRDPGSDIWTVTVDYGDGSPLQNISHLNKSFGLGHLYATAGTRTVVVTVNDGTASSHGTIAVTVAAAGPPIIHSFTGPSGAVPEGSTVTVNGSFYYGVWSQTLSIAWGDGTTTQPTVLSTGGGNYTFTAQHTYPNLPPRGAGQYTVTATWPTWTTRTLPITVVDVPPTFSSLTVPSTVPEGTLVQVGYTINAPTQNVLINRVDWGDGTSQMWSAGTLPSISPPHTYPTAGTYLMTIRVTDEDRSTDLETRAITVTDAVPTIFDFFATSEGVVEGGTASVLGHFQSPNLANDQFTVEIDWGDGRPSSTAAYHAVGGTTAAFNATHVYFDNNGANPWTATVKVTDDDGSVVTGTVAIPVGNQPPVVDAVASFDIPAGSALAKSGQITDPGSDTFTGTVNYGDGTGVQPLSIIGNSYQFNHTYAANGAYTITVTITDDDGASANRTVQVLVGPVRDLLVKNTNDAGSGSLRQAVLDANTASANSVTFPNAFAEIRFAPALSGQTIVLTSGQLLSSLRTRILATNLPGGIRISGNNASRIFQIAANNSVVLDTLHLTSGSTPQGGGAILIDSQAVVSLNRCSISDCTTTDRGGGIFFVKGAALSVNQSTVSGCMAREGGGVYFYGLGGKQLRVDNSTFTGNSATGASTSAGGAIFNESGRVAMNHSTVVSNTAAGTTSKGGGIHNTSDAMLEVNNSILAGNAGAASANISGPNSGTGNFTLGDPHLFPLGNYGGPTPTMPPRPGSPAIDAVTSVRFPVSAAPIAHWRLGEEDAGATNGGTTTSTANAYGGALTFNNPVTYSGTVSPIAAGWLDSRLGVSITTGTYGTNGLAADYLGNTAITDNFGLELWVRPNDLNGYKCLAYNGDTSANGWGLYQFGDSYGALFGGVTFIGLGSAPVTPGTWTHLALVRDQGITTLYVNGVASGTSAANPNVPAGRFAVGAQPQGLSQEFFNGTLDEVRVFVFNPGQFSPDNLSYQPTTPWGFSYLPGSGDASAYSATWSNDQRGYPRVSGHAADIGAVEIDQEVVRMKDNDGNGSLRQTLAEVAPAGVITFAPTLSGQTITLTSGELTLSNSVIIDASTLPGGISVSGNHSSRVFNVPSGSTVVLDSLTIADGSAQGTAPAGYGGGIFNSGNLTVNRCTVVGNHASTYGGGIYSDAGALTVNQCTLTRNSNAWKSGAAITIAGGLAEVNQSTVTGNTASQPSSGVGGISGSVTIHNCIVAGNSSSGSPYTNVFGPIRFTGVNLTSGSPMLTPLGNYGGPTATMPPLPGSPAIDAGAPTAFTTDQRGASRPNGPAPDIGSVEAFPFSTIQIVDTDGDGADDRMELGYFGNLTTITSSSDFDGDGSPDVSELANMTNPQDPGDNLRISSFTPAAGFNAANSPLFDVTVRTFPGLSYTLQTDAMLNAFTNVPGTTFTATNHSQTLQIHLTPARDFLRARRN